MIEPTQNLAGELSATLRDLADRVAAFEGKLPGDGGFMSLTFCFLRYSSDNNVQTTDALAMTLLDRAGEPKQTTSGSWQHKAEESRGGLKVRVYTPIDAPAEESVAVLQQRIADLEARLAAKNDSPAEPAHLLKVGGQNWCGGYSVRATWKLEKATCPDCLAARAAAVVDFKAAKDNVPAEPQMCPSCNGDGSKRVGDAYETETFECAVCNGTGLAGGEQA